MRPLPLATVAFLSLSCIALLGVGVLDPQVRPRASESGHESTAPLPPAGADPADFPPAPGMHFGIDADAVQRFAQHAGGPPDYGTVWVGKWNLDHGWRGTDASLAALRDQGVTPAVHFWYWGDDIRSDCLDFGCNGKATGGWSQLTEDLVWHLHEVMEGREVLVILESEFNKHGVHDDERFDWELAEKARWIKANYPAAKVVLGFGNWYPEAWDRFDEAAAASDYVGLQAMAGSTRDDEERFLDLLNHTLRGAEHLRELFGKPVVVQDVAVSSYPEPENLDVQAESLSRFAGGMAALQGAGVEAVIYRSFLDVPDMALANHYREAERHWGLAWHDTGQLKPAGQAWITAVQRAREALAAGHAPAVPGT